MLELGGRRLELGVKARIPLPLPVEEGCEHGQEHERDGQRDGALHAGSSTTPPIRQRPLPSDTTPIASRSCGAERRSRSPRARRCTVVGSYQIVSRANGTSARSTGSSSGPSSWIRMRVTAPASRPSLRLVRRDRSGRSRYPARRIEFPVQPCAEFEGLKSRSGVGQRGPHRLDRAPLGTFAKPASAARRALVALREFWSPRPALWVPRLTRFPGPPQILETRCLWHPFRECDRITVLSLLEMARMSAAAPRGGHRPPGNFHRTVTP